MPRKTAKGKAGPRPGMPAIRGKGAYSINSLAGKLDGLMKRIPKGTFETLGSQYGPVGGLVGKGISKISGYGSYRVNHNSLGTNTHIGAEAQNIPTFAPSEHGSRVRHREFITNLEVPAVPGDFYNTAYRLGVDNKELFPWLSDLAARYQKYKVHGMVFYYKSTSTDYNNSGAVTVVMNYNATESKYASPEQMLNSMFSVSAKPSESFAAPVECDPSQMPEGGYYVRHPGSIAEATDLRMSSVGSLNVATEGLTLPTGTVLGQLWCTYDVELLFPYVTPDDLPPFQPVTSALAIGIQSASLTTTAASLSTQLATYQDNNSGLRFTVYAGDGAYGIQWNNASQFIGRTCSVDITRLNRGGTAADGINVTGPFAPQSYQGCTAPAFVQQPSYNAAGISQGTRDNATFTITSDIGFVYGIGAYFWTGDATKCLVIASARTY